MLYYYYCGCLLVWWVECNAYHCKCGVDSRRCRILLGSWRHRSVFINYLSVYLWGCRMHCSVSVCLSLCPLYAECETKILNARCSENISTLKTVMFDDDSFISFWRWIPVIKPDITSSTKPVDIDWEFEFCEFLKFVKFTIFCEF